MPGRALRLPLHAVFSPFVAWWGIWAVLAVAGSKALKRQANPTIADPSTGPRFDVLIPAHNEAGSVSALIDSINATSNGLVGTILVVADHCTDATADVARASGASVLERSLGDNGKSLAMRDGFRHLAARTERGDAVVIVDADCVCSSDFFVHIANAFTPGTAALQTSYVQDDPSSESVRPGLRLSLALRNVVRPSGSQSLGLPVGLFGSGMVLTWDAIDVLRFGDTSAQTSGRRQPTGVDVSMWLDLLEHGVHPRFVADARVSAPSPTGADALTSQRLRWERAQLRSWGRGFAALRKVAPARDWRAGLALLDWSAPPLAPAVMVFTALTSVATVGVVAKVLPRSVLHLPTVAAAALVTYLTVGAHALEGITGARRLLLGGPKYLAWKAGAYVNRTKVADVDTRSTQDNPSHS